MAISTTACGLFLTAFPLLAYSPQLYPSPSTISTAHNVKQGAKNYGPTYRMYTKSVTIARNVTR